VLRFVANAGGEVSLLDELTADARLVLLTAALAGPHPDALDAADDPTDRAADYGASRDDGRHRAGDDRTQHGRADQSAHHRGGGTDGPSGQADRGR